MTIASTKKGAATGMSEVATATGRGIQRNGTQTQRDGQSKNKGDTNRFYESLQDLKDTLQSQRAIGNGNQALLSPSIRNDCTAVILESLSEFVMVWDTMLATHQRPPRRENPEQLVHDACSVVMDVMGIEGGSQRVLGEVLALLPKMTSPPCRQILLDILPGILSMHIDADVGIPKATTRSTNTSHDDTKENEDSTVERIPDKQTEKILEVFRDVLSKDGQSLVPIIGCLSCIPVSKRGRREAWDLSVASIPAIAETDLPVLAQTLLRNVSDTTEAVQTIDVLRAETQMLEATSLEGPCGRTTTSDTLPLLMHVVLNKLRDDQHHIRVPMTVVVTNLVLQMSI